MISPSFIFIRSQWFLDCRCGFAEIEKIGDANCQKILFLLFFRIVDIHIILSIRSNIFDNSVIPNFIRLIYRLLLISVIRRNRSTLSSIFWRNASIQRRKYFNICLSILIRIFINIYLNILLNKKLLWLIGNILTLWLKQVISLFYRFNLPHKLPLKPLKRFIIFNWTISFTILIYFV